MADSYFLEIVFVADDFEFDGRDEVEDPLEEFLVESGLGEVTGGGGGMGTANIDVEDYFHDTAAAYVFHHLATGECKTIVQVA